jgi:HD-like signal output (HDOD) protein
MEITELLEHIHELPPGARVLPRLQQLLRSPDASSDDIVKLLKVDAALTAQVLRFSNSAYFSAGAPCESVDQAVQRLGFNTVYQLVATAAAQPILDPPIQLYQLQRGELMTRSLALALFGVAVQRQMRQFKGADALYTAGLLHGIGKVAINQYFQRKGFEIYDLSNDTIMNAELETRLIGFTQAKAGGALLEHWNFSPSIVELVRHQGTPEEAGENTDLARILFFSLRSLDTLLDDDKDPLLIARDPYVGETLEVDPDKMVEVVEQVRVDLAEIARQF